MNLLCLMVKILSILSFPIEEEELALQEVGLLFLPFGAQLFPFKSGWFEPVFQQGHAWGRFYLCL